MRRMGEIALKHARRRARGRVPGPVDQRLRQRAERRHRCSSTLEAVRRAQAPSLRGRRDRRRAQRGSSPASRTASSACSRRRRSTASAASAASSCSRGPRAASGYGALHEAATGAHRQGATQTPGLAGLFSQLPGQRAAARRRRRPRPRPRRMGVPLDRRLRHAAGLPRLALRQRLQPLRPHLPGQRRRPTRRSATPAEDISAAARSATRTGEMVPLGTLVDGRSEPTARIRSIHYNGYPAADDQRRRRARLSAPARRMAADRAASPRQTLPRGMGFEWTELTYQQIAGRQHGAASSSRCACCSSSWCWPRSTRAGRCRWRSS